MTKAEFFTACKESFALNNISEYATDAYLEKFYDLTVFMLETNKKMNLTALRDENSVIARHITDCLLAAKHLPKPTKGTLKVLDVGSGGGMPCLPFAIIRPDMEITALDATAKKTACRGWSCSAARKCWKKSRICVILSQAVSTPPPPAW